MKKMTVARACHTPPVTSESTLVKIAIVAGPRYGIRLSNPLVMPRGRKYGTPLMARKIVVQQAFTEAITSNPAMYPPIES